MGHLWPKRIFLLILVAVSITAVYHFTAVWLEYHLLYPSEQEFAQVTNGEQIAAFSVKYEGRYSWWPANPKPHFYITLTETDSGKVILRETDFDWPHTGSSFSELARVYAPWAEYRFQPGVKNRTSLMP